MALIHRDREDRFRPGLRDAKQNFPDGYVLEINDAFVPDGAELKHLGVPSLRQDREKGSTQNGA